MTLNPRIQEKITASSDPVRDVLTVTVRNLVHLVEIGFGLVATKERRLERLEQLNHYTRVYGPLHP